MTRAVDKKKPRELALAGLILPQEGGGDTVRPTKLLLHDQKPVGLELRSGGDWISHARPCCAVRRQNSVGTGCIHWPCGSA
ncbi:hypothetical protein ABTE27_20670, partial [Acinetobacter baumannii]